MTIDKLITNALNHGRTAFYDGTPNSLDACHAHIYQVFKFNKTELPVAQTTTINWWCKRVIA